VRERERERASEREREEREPCECKRITQVLNHHQTADLSIASASQDLKAKGKQKNVQKQAELAGKRYSRRGEKVDRKGEVHHRMRAPTGCVSGDVEDDDT
jgi:hypothetical protein